MIPDRDSLPFSYAISGDPEVDPPAVTVTGPAEEVDVLDRAEVTVPLRSARTTVSDEPSVILKDANGKVLLDLTPDPAKVQVTIPIRQGFNTRDAAVHVVITGTVAPGYWISDISVDPDTVTLLGPPSVLEQMGGFVDTIPVDVNGVAGDINRRVPLAPPVGVTALNQSGVSEGSVEVHATVQALLGNLRLSVPIEIVGARPGDSVSTSPASVDVLLAGPLPVLNQVNADQKLVRVIIDVSELSPGSQEISPTLIAPESLQATMVPNIVQLVIERPSATAQPGATTTPEPTPTP
jgi:YbbR domain-containing protein